MSGGEDGEREGTPICVICRGRIEDAPVDLITFRRAVEERSQAVAVYFTHPECLQRVAVKPFAGVDEL
jgi:hypothetical protein